MSRFYEFSQLHLRHQYDCSIDLDESSLAAG